MRPVLGYQRIVGKSPKGSRQAGYQALNLCEPFLPRSRESAGVPEQELRRFPITVPDAPAAPGPPFTGNWYDRPVRFDYGNPVEPPEPPPPGHRGTYDGQWRQRVVCRTCGAICLPDREQGGYADPGSIAEDEDAPGLPHFYPFGQDPGGVMGVAEAVRDDDPEPAMEDWEPERYVLCKDADGCLEWQSHPGPHTREMRTARAREIAFEESKGLDPTMPRHKMPSRIDRSAEYARRNRARRHGLRG